jgi:uncharacterized membrane protein
MNKYFNWINTNILYLFLIFLLLLNLLPIIAPVLLHYDFNEGSRAIYQLYSFFCHQQHWKSLHLYDHQIAWCARDMFIWGSMLLVLIIVLVRNTKPLSLLWLIIYSIPMLLDGGLQTLAVILGYSDSSVFYVSSNLSRMITGSIFGSGFGLYIFPRMKEIVQQEKVSSSSGSSFKIFKGGTHHIKIILIILLIMSLIYITFIQLWQITSTEYLPTNFLDTETKLPEDNRDWFLRRQRGI